MFAVTCNSVMIHGVAGKAGSFEGTLLRRFFCRDETAAADSVRAHAKRRKALSHDFDIPA